MTQAVIFDPAKAQRNALNQVAVLYYQTVNPTFEVNGTTYAFRTQHNICLCWVEEADVQIILNRTKTCCGNHTRHVFRLATETDVRRWTNGGR